MPQGFRNDGSKLGFQKGIPHSILHKLKISQANKGRKFSLEARAKMSLAGKGKKLTEEHKRKIGLKMLGLKKSELTRKRLSDSLKGKKRTPEVVEKTRQSLILKIPKHKHSWRIRAHWALKGIQKICFACKATKKIHIHHIDGNVKNNEIANLQMLCPKCHTSLHFNEQTRKRDKYGKFQSINSNT